MDLSNLAKKKDQKQFMIASWSVKKDGDSVRVTNNFDPDSFVNQLVYGYLTMASFNQDFVRTFPLFDEPLTIDEPLAQQFIINLQNEIKNF